MSIAELLDDEVREVAIALGLLDNEGEARADWFQHPHERLATMLTDPTQRQALLAALASLLPPARLPGLPSGQRWHPLLKQAGRGQIYLTLDAAEPGTRCALGLAGRVRAEAATPPAGPWRDAEFAVDLWLVEAENTTVRSAIEKRPLRVRLDVGLDLAFARDGIGLGGVGIEVGVLPPNGEPEVRVILRQLDLAGTGATPELVIDSDHPGPELLTLVSALLQRLGGAAGAAREIGHLLGLLGIGTTASAEHIPPFPFADLGQAGSVRAWLRALAMGDPLPLKPWLDHLAGLFGASGPLLAGTSGASWPLNLVLLNGGPDTPSLAASIDVRRIGAELASLLPGLALEFALPSVDSRPAALTARAVLADIPLAAATAPAPLPEVALGVRLGDPATGRWLAPGLVGALQAELSWRDKTFVPAFTLHEVHLGNQPSDYYKQLDLTDLETIATAAIGGLIEALLRRLGLEVNAPGGPARYLSTLAALQAPTGDPSSPHTLARTLTSARVTQPLAALAEAHRAALADPAHPWAFVFDDLALLIGAAGPGGRAGTGTRDDPWRRRLGGENRAELQLAAWQEARAGDARRLGLGLRVELGQGQPWRVCWLAELLAFEIGANGAVEAGFMGCQQLAVSLRDLAVPRADLAFHAGALSAGLGWQIGETPTWAITAEQIRVSGTRETICLPRLEISSARCLDVERPDLGLGIPKEMGPALLRMLLARALELAGQGGVELAALLGLQREQGGLPPDWPLLQAPDLGRLLEDPLDALHRWLAQVATDCSADGVPFALTALELLQTLAAHDPHDGAGSRAGRASLGGCGTAADPWYAAINNVAQPSAEILLWLTPDGPAPDWLAPLVTQAAATRDATSVAHLLVEGIGLPAWHRVLAGIAPERLAEGIAQLEALCDQGDGVVPLSSQSPEAGWLTAPVVTASHGTVLAAPAAIDQILTQARRWGGPVVLLSSPLGDRADWQPLLAAAERAAPGSTAAGAHFDLRAAACNPAEVNARVGYYTVDLPLSDAVDQSMACARLAPAIARVRELHGNARVVLVGHGVAGLTAAAFAVRLSSAVGGLITVVTPHHPVEPLIFERPELAEAVRALVVTQVAGGLASPFRELLQELAMLIDGYRSGGATPPRPLPLVRDQLRSGALETPGDGVPAMAVRARAGANLTEALGRALSGRLAALARPAPPPRAPSHLGYGVRLVSAVDDGPGAITARWSLRLDLGALPVAPAGAARLAAERLVIELELAREAGWLVGGPQPGGTCYGIRARRATLGIALEPGQASQARVTVHGYFDDAQCDGPPVLRLSLAAPQGGALLGAALRELNAPGAGRAAKATCDALLRLGIVAEQDGEVGMPAPVLAVLLADPAAYLGPRLLQALNDRRVDPSLDPENIADRSLLGLQRQPDGVWQLAVGDLPVALTVSGPGPWRVALTTTRAALPLGTAGSLSGSVGLSLADLSLAAELVGWLAGLQIKCRTSGGATSVSIGAPPVFAPVTLAPLPPGGVRRALADVVPRLLLAAVVESRLAGMLGDQWVLPSLLPFLLDPPGWLTGATALSGAGDDLLDAAGVNRLLGLAARAAGLTEPERGGIVLPGGFTLRADNNPFKLRLTHAGYPLPGSGELKLGVETAVGRTTGLSPGGEVALKLPLNGVWAAVTLRAAYSPTGLLVQVLPEGADGQPITLWPEVRGLAELATAAGVPALLGALDRLAGPPGANQADPMLKAAALQLAQVLGLYDPSGRAAQRGFTQRATAWRTLMRNGHVLPAGDSLAKALEQVLSVLAGPNRVTSQHSTVSYTIRQGSSQKLMACLAPDAYGLSIQVDGLAKGAVAVRRLKAGYVAGQLDFDLLLTVDWPTQLSVPLHLGLHATVEQGRLKLELLPLGEGELAVRVLPPPASVAEAVHQGSLGDVITNLALPLVIKALVDACEPQLNKSLWKNQPTQPGESPKDGPTLNELLKAGGILRDGQVRFPRLLGVLYGALSTLKGQGIAVSTALRLEIGVCEAGVGLVLRGTETFEAGALKLTLELGTAKAQPGGAAGGLKLLLWRGGTTFTPKVAIDGCGLEVARKADKPLLATSVIRLGSAGGAISLEWDLAQAPTMADLKLGLGLHLGGLGLPLGSGGESGNPVASALLKGDSKGEGVSPPVDLDVRWRHAQPLQVVFGNAPAGKVQWLGVRRSFGPIYVEQIGLEYRETERQVRVLLDGGVQTSVFAAQVDDLAVTVPLSTPLDPAAWGLDLAGLAVGLKAGPVAIAGALRRGQGAEPEYEGLLLVNIAGRGITVVGAYARPKSAGSDQRYTSFMVFGALQTPLGGSPYFYVVGLGAGMGYNRQLALPADVGAIPHFLLVRAIDGPDLTRDLKGTMAQMRQNFAPQHGSFWLAAGVTGLTFALLRSTLVAYVSLGRGFEVGIIGKASLKLPPTGDRVLAQLELGLLARYSSEEGSLVVRAQLTEQSWLFSPSCRLTGGFALGFYFKRGQFLLSVGGYHPAFQRPDYFPLVPRVGLNWQVSSAVTIKGEQYFAITSSCLMLGGGLEAVFDIGWLRAWFNLYFDLLFSWDPPHYEAEVGISLGARVTVDLWLGTVTKEISIGATCFIEGPPLRGHGYVDLEVTEFPFSFGDEAPGAAYLPDWGSFREKYLVDKDKGKDNYLAISVSKGLLPPPTSSIAAAEAANEMEPGSEQRPWRLGLEFALLAETSLPASCYSSWWDGERKRALDPAGRPIVIDVAPRGLTDVTSVLTLKLFKRDEQGQRWVEEKLADRPKACFEGPAPQIKPVPAALWHFVPGGQTPAAASTVWALVGLTFAGRVLIEGARVAVVMRENVDDNVAQRRHLPFTRALVVNPGEPPVIGPGWPPIRPLGPLPAAAPLGGASSDEPDTLARARQLAGLKAKPSPRTTARRSAPPLLVPLGGTSAGAEAGVSDPPLPPPAPAPLPQAPRPQPRPRLRAVLHGAVPPTPGLPPAPHTSVRRLPAAAAAVRKAPPRPDGQTLVGLSRARPRSDARPTAGPEGGPTLYAPATGWPAGTVRARARSEAEARVGADIVVPAGLTHLWELPAGELWSLVLGGDAARYTCLSRSGAVLLDRELVAGRETRVDLPTTTAVVAVGCLGRLSERLAVAHGLGAVALAAAPAGRPAVAGWQRAGMLTLVGPTTLLGRGAYVELDGPLPRLNRARPVAHAIVPAAAALAGRRRCVTYLPAAVEVVVVVLELADPQAGDRPRVVPQGARLIPAGEVSSGQRVTRFYSVTERQAGLVALRVSVDAGRAWSIEGVVGLPGRAEEWVGALAGRPFPQLVADTALSAEGQVRLSLLTRGGHP